MIDNAQPRALSREEAVAWLRSAFTTTSQWADHVPPKWPLAFNIEKMAEMVGIVRIPKI